MFDLYDLMTVDIPEGELNGMRVERFEVAKDNIRNFRASLEARGTKPGIYTKLTGDGKFWMSDTDAEKKDHMTALREIYFQKAERVLINGLGLGMVLKAALSFNHVLHVDVVEKDERVIKLVGPHYQRDSRVYIHHADAYEQAKKWPAGTRWNVGWSDIWPDVTTDALPEMAKLNRSYGRRCDWHSCWAQENLKRIQRYERSY